MRETGQEAAVTSDAWVDIPVAVTLTVVVKEGHRFSVFVQVALYSTEAPGASDPMVLMGIFPVPPSLTIETLAKVSSPQLVTTPVMINDAAPGRLVTLDTLEEMLMPGLKTYIEANRWTKATSGSHSFLTQSPSAAHPGIVTSCATPVTCATARAMEPLDATVTVQVIDPTVKGGVPNARFTFVAMEIIGPGVPSTSGICNVKFAHVISQEGCDPPGVGCCESFLA